MKGVALIAAVLCGAHAVVAARKPVLKGPVMVNGRPFKLTEGVPKQMCKAVISEMHTEITKHDLRKGGEEDIFETAGMAICLGVVQNYIFEERKGGRWALRAKTAAEKEAEEEGGLGSMRLEGMLLVKEACFAFCDELQQEISEKTYTGLGQGKAAEDIATDFCVDSVLSPAPKKKAKAKPKAASKEEKAKRAKKAAADAEGFGAEGLGEAGTQEQYESFLKKMNMDGSISELLRTDRENPALLLPEEDQEEVRQATAQLQCAVCKVGVKQVKQIADSDPLVARDEAKLWEHAKLSFHGQEMTDESADATMNYVPGNPPSWAESYAVRKGSKGKWELRRLRSGESLVAEGGDMYTARVKRNTIVGRAAKQVWLQAEESDSDLAELMVSHKGWDAKKLSASFCKSVCKSTETSDEL
eukprot:Hpha_TRINITY_DN3787_c0_g1::TRINITY_DN3787_c0_g1_i1::g.23885::m.23885